jgi:four helix bundle protein
MPETTTSRAGLLGHERLDVYVIALDFVVNPFRIAHRMGSGNARLADQLRRASTTGVPHIAEGACEYSRREKVRFDRMAVRSATECAAILELARRLRLAESGALVAGKEMLNRCVAMRTKLIPTLERRGRRTATGPGRGTGHG